jgi:two-component system KDP operon response regulator KdpE
LPDFDGLELVRRLRKGSTAPVVIVSARTDAASISRALDGGADDYLAKPFRLAELAARVRVALQRTSRSPPSGAVAIGTRISVDLVRRAVFVEGREVHLTPKQYALLTALLTHADAVVTDQYLLDAVWGRRRKHKPEYLRESMKRLRDKLEEAPSRPAHLLTVPGIGYRLQTAPRSGVRGVRRARRASSSASGSGPLPRVA